MIWYSLDHTQDGWIVFKNVMIGKGIGSKSKFIGSKTECIKFCKEHKINLGLKNKANLTS